MIEKLNILLVLSEIIADIIGINFCFLYSSEGYDFKGVANWGFIKET